MSVAARMSDRPRHVEEVALVMVDGTRIHGMLHRTPGTRTLDFLNRQAEGFVAITDAILIRADVTEHAPFVAINKTHILHVIEADDTV
jgi:hypothetical protein